MSAFKIGNYRKIGFLVVLGTMTVSNAFACAVPVFRYALERWPSDTYTITQFRSGPLPPAEQAIADAWQAAATNFTANITLTDRNVSGNTHFPLPWLTVDFPDEKAMPLAAWRGPFTADATRSLLDSPVRRELIRRIIQGDSVVWLLLDGDASAARLLDSELAKLQKEVTVPEVDPDDPRTEGNRDLKIVFSVLPISHADPSEKLFVEMLLHTDPALTNVIGPVAFPIFGRGRLLMGLTGKDLTAATIGQVSHYLCGNCSCEIKQENPGVDLLLAVNWDEAIQKLVIQDPPLPPLIGLGTLAVPKPTTVLPSGHAPGAVEHRSLRRNLILVFAFVAGIVALGTLLFQRWKRP